MKYKIFQRNFCAAMLLYSNCLLYEYFHIETYISQFPKSTLKLVSLELIIAATK